jgi:hypothetical protein
LDGKFIDLSLLIKSASEIQDQEGQGGVGFKEGRLGIVKPKTNFLNIDR